MRFLVDMNLAAEVAVWLRSQGHDAVHLRGAGLQELGDEAVLAKAVAERRVVLTFDLDFAAISAAAAETPVAVVLFRLRSAQTAQIIGRLRAVLASAAAQALEKGAVVIVEPSRLRVRRPRSATEIRSSPPFSRMAAWASEMFWTIKGAFFRAFQPGSVRSRSRPAASRSGTSYSSGAGIWGMSDLKNSCLR